MTSHPLPTPPSHDDLASKVLDRIADEQVTPRPEWQYTWKNRIIWIFAVIGIACAATVASAVIFTWTEVDWSLWELTSASPLSFLSETIPFVWLFGVALAIAAVFLNIRHTKLGYRYPFSLILALTLAGACIGGLLLHASGLGRTVDENIGAHIPLHRPAMMRKMRLWMNPSRGLIVGELASFDEATGAFSLETPDGRVIAMEGASLSPQSKAVLLNTPTVRVIGYAEADAATGSTRFVPCAVLPWDGERAVRMRLPPPLPEPPRPALKEMPDLVRSTGCKDLQPYAILKRISPNH